MYPRIRLLRENNELNQKTLARHLNISQTTYSRYESGVLEIPTSSLIVLAEFYHTSTDYILGLTNDRRPYSRVG